MCTRLSAPWNLPALPTCPTHLIGRAEGALALLLFGGMSRPSVATGYA